MDTVSAEQALLRLLRGEDVEASTVETSDIRYALYARKSTTDDERQERSIDDQVHDCIKQQVLPNRLNVVQTIEESFSAKTSGTRYKFRQLIRDIEDGKITGLIAWHPDRLARNMKEAGELIDLLARGVLKDLRFATFTFENNPTGKMLLGISFVLSQQYSEHLSESVSRGNRRLTEDGAYLGRMKHGYYINQNRELHPEETHFSIIQQAFQKRLDGEGQLGIAKWLNTTGYEVRKNGGRLERYKWDKDAVSKLFRDPTYAGVMRYGDNYVVLSEKYSFIPMISVADFLKINKIKSLDSPKVLSVARTKRTQTKADFLRGLVTCAYCDMPFSSGLVKKRLKNEDVYYYYYKCETDDCVFKGKSVRAKIIIDLVKDFFHEYLFITRHNYSDYLQNANEQIRVKSKEVDSSMARNVKALYELKKVYEEEKSLIRDNPKLSRHYSLDDRKEAVVKLEEQINKQKNQKIQLKEVILPFEEYLKLFSSIGVIFEKTNNMKHMDLIIKFFFSNFSVKAFKEDKKQRYEIDYKLKEPWQGFLENDKFVRGRGERTRTFDLTVPNRAR